MTQQADADALANAAPATARSWRRQLKPDQDTAQLKPANDAGADGSRDQSTLPANDVMKDGQVTQVSIDIAEEFVRVPRAFVAEEVISRLNDYDIKVAA